MEVISRNNNQAVIFGIAMNFIVMVCFKTENLFFKKIIPPLKTFFS